MSRVVYVNGEFVGGCDIVREMFESGELKDYFENNKILSYFFELIINLYIYLQS